jgi:competence transcription factor ComK
VPSCQAALSPSWQADKLPRRQMQKWQAVFQVKKIIQFSAKFFSKNINPKLHSSGP